MPRNTCKKYRRLWLLGIASVVAEPLAMKLRGYPMGGKLIVRCRQGHLFTTFWLPGMSFKALRLGWWRYQRCPVGGHWSLITPVRPSELSESDARKREAVRTSRCRSCSRSTAQEQLGRLRKRAGMTPDTRTG